MGSGFSKMKKQAKMLQEQMAEMKEKMKNTVVTGSAGGGLVEITINGDKEVQKVKIKPDCVDKDDIEGLEDLVMAAFNEASKQIEEENPSSSMGIPGIGMPF